MLFFVVYDGGALREDNSLLGRVEVTETGVAASGAERVGSESGCVGDEFV